MARRAADRELMAAGVTGLSDQELTMIGIIRQLPKKQQSKVEDYLDRMRAEAEAG